MIRALLRALNWVGVVAETEIVDYDDPYGRSDDYTSEPEVDRLRRQIAAIGEGLGLGADWDPDDCMDMIEQAGHLYGEWSDAQVELFCLLNPVAGESS